MAELARYIGANGIFGSQLLDVEFTNLETPFCIDTLKFINLRKATAMTEVSVVIGGGSDLEIKQLRDYGRWIGFLHQVVDDILNVDNDLTIDKTSYQKLLWMEKSREFADELLRAVKSKIEGFYQLKARQ